MFKVGDKIKFVGVETYKKQSGNSNPSNLKLQEKIAGYTDTIVRVEGISDTFSKLYYTSRKHYNGQDYFLAERFRKIEIVSLDDELFKI